MTVVVQTREPLNCEYLDGQGARPQKPLSPHVGLSLSKNLVRAATSPAAPFRAQRFGHQLAARVAPANTPDVASLASVRIGALPAHAWPFVRPRNTPVRRPSTSRANVAITCAASSSERNPNETMRPTSGGCCESSSALADPTFMSSGGSDYHVHFSLAVATNEMRDVTTSISTPSSQNSPMRVYTSQYRSIYGVFLNTPRRPCDTE